MTRFVARRLLGMVAVLFAISVIVFLIFNVIPNSDPAARIAGKNADPALIARVNADLGLDRPLPIQYLTMMKQIFTGQLTSYAKDRNVVQQIWDGVPATFSLCIGAAVIWLFFGVLVGVISAVTAGRASDRLITTFALVGISMPVFWLGIVLRYFLAEKNQIFPDGGYVPLTSDPWQWLYHLILPWFCLAVLFIGFYGRVLRSNMLDAMNEDYVRTAKAKGVSARKVLRRHVLRNSLIPIVTLFGLDFAAVLGGGAILTETVFDLKGVGWYAAQSVGGLDLPPIMGVTLYGAFFIVLFSAIVDFIYAYLDPRVRPT
jgi:peptide/nickel transport system permease protein